MKKIFIFTILLVGCLKVYAQPNLSELEGKDILYEYMKTPPATILIIKTEPETKKNQYGQIVSTTKYGVLQKPFSCYFVTDRYSIFAQKLGPQKYMLMCDGSGTFIYSFRGNRLNPGCVKYVDKEIFPCIGDRYKYLCDYYQYEIPADTYSTNKEGEAIIKISYWPEVMQLLFKNAPEYYDAYSPLCKKMNLSDPVFSSLLIEALIRYNGGDSSFLFCKEIVCSLNGFKACSGKSSIRIIKGSILSFYPLEPVMPVNSDNDKLINYPKDNRSFSQNYLKQVKLTKTIPRDYGSIQFKGKPQVLTDLYGYEVVFDDANMYYFQK
mgnify:FL=1